MMNIADLPPPAVRISARERLRHWIEYLHGDPDAEEKAMEERRRRLLDSLTREVAEAPDDMPISQVVRRLNDHWPD